MQTRADMLPAGVRQNHVASRERVQMTKSGCACGRALQKAFRAKTERGNTTHIALKTTDSSLANGRSRVCKMGGAMGGATALLLLIAFSGAGAPAAYCVNASVHPAVARLEGRSQACHGKSEGRPDLPNQQAGSRSCL